MLSPMMACEEAWLFGQAMRALDPQALLVLGPVPTTGQDEVFKNPANGKQTFVIKGEKVPNAAGIRRVLEMLGGPTATWDELLANQRPELAKLKGGWTVGGYLSRWLSPLPDVLKRGFRVVQDILPNALTDVAEAVLPAAAWAEKDGCWENYAGPDSAVRRRVAPPAGCAREGDVFNRMLGHRGAVQCRGRAKADGRAVRVGRVPD